MGINASILNEETDKTDNIYSYGLDTKIDKKKNFRRERKNLKISASIFYILVAILLLFTIFNKSWIQNNNNYSCPQSWIDIIISVITWTALIIGGYLIGKALSLTNKSKDNQKAMIDSFDNEFETPARIARKETIPELMVNETENQIKTSEAQGVTPWLTAVRNDAYETHRRLSSLCPELNNDLNKVSNPITEC